MLRVRNMKSKCEDELHLQYDKYGGRGVEFRFDSVPAAAEWIALHMGADDEKQKMELCLLDDNGHFAPDNLQWRRNVKFQKRLYQGLRWKSWLCWFRHTYPKIGYADTSLRNLAQANTAAEIAAKWESNQNKEK